MNYSALNYLKNGVNRADVVKDALIFVANTDEKIFKTIRDNEEALMSNNIEVEPKTIYFNPNEIDRIILRNDEGLEK